MAAPDYFRSPLQLLEELGIEDPQDLDIEAIAHHCGALIVYKRLTGSAARITGKGDHAIITVDSESPRARQRFSAGHELGHWMYDRGKLSFSCEENKLVREWSRANPETAANRYSSDLLLPVALFKPHAYALKTIDFNTVRALATTFQTSLTATAIRLVEHGPLPAMLIFSSEGRREWFFRGPDIPKSLFPRDVPTEASYASDLLNREEKELSGEVSAEAWFDHWGTSGYWLHEHSIRIWGRLMLSLLWWKGTAEQMLVRIEEYEERRDARRSDESWRRR